MNKISREHRRGVSAYKRGEVGRWIAALDAESIVRKYRRGATLAYAQDLSRSADTVENYAKGYFLYKLLRSDIRYVSEMRFIRRQLTLSHFTTAARAWHKYEIPIEDIFSVLQDAYQNGASVRTMRSYLDAAHTEDPLPLPQIKATKILKELRWLSETTFDNSPAVQKAAAVLIKVIERAWSITG